MLKGKKVCGKLRVKYRILSSIKRYSSHSFTTVDTPGSPPLADIDVLDLDLEKAVLRLIV